MDECFEAPKALEEFGGKIGMVHGQVTSNEPEASATDSDTSQLTGRNDRMRQHLHGLIRRKRFRLVDVKRLERFLSYHRRPKIRCAAQTPIMTPRNPTRTLPKTFARAASQFPSRISLNVSHSNVEKVVYPPQNPVPSRR